MSVSFREGKFDVAIVAGPRVRNWPTAGARSLSALCTAAGLNVGFFGGDTMKVRGVLPLPVPGGVVLVEDLQSRIHRIHARAVVRISADLWMPDPFPGWRSDGLVPLSTAVELKRESHVRWDPCTVILGSGNKALRFASELLESGVRRVLCVEPSAQWGAKRFAGWEVEKRRLELLGGRLIEAVPVKLSPKAAMLWELRLRDAQGVRLLEVARVVSAGPFAPLAESPGIREYPAGSNLFEIEQTAEKTPDEDVEGWVMEEERGIALAGRLIKALVAQIEDPALRERLDRLQRRARGRLKRWFLHRDQPFTPAYHGKWLAPADARRVREFRGVPRVEQLKRQVASIECFEDIPCAACQRACPEGALELGHVPRIKDRVLIEDKCTGCGLCVSACPSGAAVLLEDLEARPLSRVTLPWRARTAERRLAAGTMVSLLNRRGETLATARVVAVEPAPESAPAAAPERVPGDRRAPPPAPAPGDEAWVQRVTVEVPSHLVWEARGLRPQRAADAADDRDFLRAAALAEWPGWMQERVEVTLDGEKRFVRDQVPASIAFFENGLSRPEDVLLCPDGSCGLCQIRVDGTKKRACQTQLHKGMVIESAPPIPAAPTTPAAEDVLCPCTGTTYGEVLERLKQGKLRSPDALLSATHVGEGRCHGQLCMGAFRRILISQGLENAAQWIDWRFPSVDWTLGRG